MSSGRTAPVRTCVGCRERAATSVLVRVLALEVDGVLSVVPCRRGSLPGRGASLHPTLGCLALAERRRAIGRALRRPGPLDTRRLRAQIETLEARARQFQHE